MALQSAGQMSFADVYNEITGESLPNPPISITLAELGQLQNASGQTIPLNQNSPYKPDGVLPTVFPDEWYRYCQTCANPKPLLQITKQASLTANAGEFFNYFLTITNNGEATTNGNIIITDTIPNNIIISSVTGDNMYYTVTNQTVVITYFGILGVRQSASFYIIIKTFNSGTYYNQASVQGGGDTIIRFSNTTVTSVSTASYTSTITERRDRTLQRNNCGDFGTGSFVQVFSPYFTTTYTSFISQQDAENQARAESVRLANNWLDANAQNVANSEGTCGFQYPNLQLDISGTNAISKDRTGNINVRIRAFTQPTTGNITINIPLSSGLLYNDLVRAPAGWSINVINLAEIQLITNQSLNVGYDDFFTLKLYGANLGSYNVIATANGGGLAASVNSNTWAITVFAAANYSLASFNRNNDFKPNGPGTFAAPADDAYYACILNVNNAPSASDTLLITASPPGFFPLTQVEVIFANPDNIPKFNVNKNILSGLIEITNNTSVQGGISIYFKLPMAMDYFRISTAENPPLTVNSTGEQINILQLTTFQFKLNNTFIEEKTAAIRWTNNFAIQFKYSFQNTPSNLNGLQLRFRRVYEQNFTTLNITPTPSNYNFYITNILFTDPTRGTPNAELSYPYLETRTEGFFFPEEFQYFGLYVYLELYHNGVRIQHTVDVIIDSNENYGIWVKSLTKDPKLRFAEINIKVDSNGNYIPK
jgi:uncharacterized repeat protein (TIGR01451 family)